MNEKDMTTAIFAIARAITADAHPAPDAQGCVVSSLTEAVMGLTKAMTEIASAIGDLAHEAHEWNANANPPHVQTPAEKLEQDALLKKYFEDKGIL